MGKPWFLLLASWLPSWATNEIVVKIVFLTIGGAVRHQCPLLDRPLVRLAALGQGLSLGHVLHQRLGLVRARGGGGDFSSSGCRRSIFTGTCCRHRLLRRLHDLFHVRMGNLQADPRRQLGHGPGQCPRQRARRLCRAWSSRSGWPTASPCLRRETPEQQMKIEMDG